MVDSGSTRKRARSYSRWTLRYLPFPAMSFDPELLNQCWFLAGPTACGKSATGLVLAERLDAEILSLDSMAVYRGMDIGTAKASAADRACVRVHLIDLVDPDEDFSVADYVALAESASRDILRRGKTPLFVGGTGLYLRSILRGLFAGPGSDAGIRSALEEIAWREGSEALHRRLVAVDPVTAARLHPNDVRRVVRALEVAELTGRPLSSFHEHGPAIDPPPHVRWLSPERDWLYQRIETRVDAMLAQGLLAETERLLAASGGLGRTARQALGYRELIAHLEENVPLGEAVALIKRRTRQFAKRQMTWFRNLEECRMVPMTGQESAEQLAARIP